MRIEADPGNHNPLQAFTLVQKSVERGMISCETRPLSSASFANSLTNDTVAAVHGDSAQTSFPVGCMPAGAIELDFVRALFTDDAADPHALAGDRVATDRR